MATLDIKRRRDAAAAGSGSHPVPPLRRPDARRSRRAGRPLWRECVVDRSPGAMPHGRVRWRDLLPRGPALWWTVADPGRRCGAARRAEPMPASPPCAWSTSPLQRQRSAARYRAPLTARPRQGSLPAWAETRHGARGASLEPGPVQPEPPTPSLHFQLAMRTASISPTGGAGLPELSRAVGFSAVYQRASQGLPLPRPEAWCVRPAAHG